MILSRRDFRRLSGATLVGAALPPLRAGWGAPRVRFAGRALETVAVRAAPLPDADIVRVVHPDRVLPLALSAPKARSFREAMHESTLPDGWYEVPGPGGGYVRARQVQPMVPYTPPEVITRVDAPFWAEVVAPVTVMRRWPLPDAPALGRMGYGATLHVVDAQADDWGHAWYRDGEAGGWVQALHARRLDPEDLAPIHSGKYQTRGLSPLSDSEKRMEIDAARCRLTAWEGDEIVLVAPISCRGTARHALTPENGAVIPRKHPARHVAGYWGAPWFVEAEGLALHGAYWHNDFGACEAAQRSTPDSELKPTVHIDSEAITLAPAVARWVYRWVEIEETRVFWMRETTVLVQGHEGW